MTKRAKIIIGALIALLLGGAIIAGLYANGGTNPAKSSNQIKADIEEVFKGKEYFKEVQVKSYSGMAEEKNPDAAAKSAAIQISFNKLDAATFKEAASLIPELEMTAFYSLGDTEKIASITSVTGFKYVDFKDETTVNDIAKSLEARESFTGPYWQVSRGNAEGDDASKMKTQFVTTETNVTEIRKTVDSVLTPKMDVLPVTQTELSQGSFSQFAAVDGKMDNYNKGLEIGLKFADAVFLDSQQVVMLGLGDTIQVSYTALRAGLDKDKITEITKELNKDQAFKITVVSPEDAAAANPNGPAPTASATPSESATPSPVATPSSSEPAK